MVCPLGLFLPLRGRLGMEDGGDQGILEQDCWCLCSEARRGALDVLLVTVRLGPGMMGREEALGSCWLL